MSNNIGCNNFNSNGYNMTSLHKVCKNNNIGYLHNNPFQTVNFIQSTHHQRTNSNFTKTQHDDKIFNKYHISNVSQENKSASLKILVTDATSNGTYTKPTIKLHNEKLMFKLKKYENNNKEADNDYNFLNHKCSTNKNNNSNNIKYNHINGNNNNTLSKPIANCISSYNNLHYKNNNGINNVKCRHQHYNNLVKRMNSNESNNKKSKIQSTDPTNIALSLVLDGNLTSSHNYNINNNLGSLVNNNSKKDVKYFHNSNNNLNININNQININTNSTSNSNNKNLKDYLNTKIKNQDVGLYNFRHGSKYINANAATYISGGNGFNFNNLNFQEKKYKTRNINSGLKSVNTHNCNFHNNYISNKGDKIIKSYHSKNVSSLTDLMNNNKKLMTMYNKNCSKSKSKEKK